jgi:PAS domain S-box-containing protein
VLIVATASAVLFAVGSALGIFARLQDRLASGGLGEALGLALVALAGTALFALRRSVEVNREQRLRETADARLRALIEGSPAVSYSWDPATHRHLYVSPQVEQLLGVSPERYTEDWVDMIHPDDRERVLASSAEADDAGTRFVAEYRAYRADGALVWMREALRIGVRRGGGDPFAGSDVRHHGSPKRRTLEHSAEQHFGRWSSASPRSPTSGMRRMLRAWSRPPTSARRSSTCSATTRRTG